MNKQKEGGIEWCDYTWNPLGGCYHDCKWVMPDGSVASCYAKEIAEGLASKAYPEGFEHIYFHEDRLLEPLRVKQPSRIFLDSMSDLFGAKVPPRSILRILWAVADNPQHTFLSLTKNPTKMLKYRFDISTNMHVGISSPPNFMYGKELTELQRWRLWTTSLKALRNMGRERPALKLWVSFEPLTFDPFCNTALKTEVTLPTLDWIVIGAASNGKTKYQPDRYLVWKVFDWAQALDIPVWFKTNLDWKALGFEKRYKELP